MNCLVEKGCTSVLAYERHSVFQDIQNVHNDLLTSNLCRAQVLTCSYCNGGSEHHSANRPQKGPVNAYTGKITSD